MRSDSFPIGATLLAITTTSSALFADTLAVPGDHATIQAAIDAAVDGDIVLVQPGTYPEAIDFDGRSITVRSAAGPATTIIDATGLDASVVTIASNESAATLLEGFRITGGTGTSAGAFTEGGGMRIRQASPVIRDCVIVGNGAQFGGGVHVGHDTMGIRFEACLILDNHSTLGGGGGIHHFGPELVVDRCRILGNVAEFGGGVLSYGPGTTLIANSLISGNRATGSFCCFGNGGGGYNANQGRETQLVNVTFAGNTATASSGSRGGAVHIVDDVSPAVITNCLFHENDDTMGFADVSDTFDAATVSHCLLQQSWGGAGGSNLVTDSFLIDPDGVDDVYGTPDDNPNLAPGSACTEAGDASALPAEFDTCLVGNPRVINLIDIGAMEYPVPPCTADLDGSGAVDFTDLLTLLSSWGACGGCPADLDHDDMVGFSDLLAVLQAWGPCA